ncbi:MAG: hypothetical protein MUF34_20765 [Polyangiaceae bacterium]|jgi:hypothetical protein|nr:hypothetical protein [Polyangiaceae bacterium]
MFARRPLTSPLAALAAFAATGALTLLGPPGCDEGSDPPGAQRVTLATRAISEGQGTGPFTTSTNWTVTLTHAQVSLGALYYFDGEPVLSRLGPTKAPGRRGWPFGVRNAFAHPGHYLPGNAVGQMLQASTFDLSAGDTALPAGDGLTGAFRSAKVVFAAPADGGAAISIEGRAEQGALAHAFTAAFTADELRAEEGATESAVEGCAFETAEVRGDGTVTIVVHPAVWLDQVDFSELPAAAAGAPATPLPADSSARRALLRGLKKGLAYVFRYSP